MYGQRHIRYYNEFQAEINVLCNEIHVEIVNPRKNNQERQL